MVNLFFFSPKETRMSIVTHVGRVFFGHNVSPREFVVFEARLAKVRHDQVRVAYDLRYMVALVREFLIFSKQNILKFKFSFHSSFKKTFYFSKTPSTQMPLVSPRLLDRLETLLCLAAYSYW
jgi:hypothetical protein